MGKWRRRQSLQKRYNRSRLINKYGNTCYLCDLPIERMGDITIDHWIPLSKGGKDEFENYRLAHEKCNNAKANMTPDEWRNWQENT